MEREENGAKAEGQVNLELAVTSQRLEHTGTAERTRIRPNGARPRRISFSTSIHQQYSHSIPAVPCHAHTSPVDSSQTEGVKPSGRSRVPTSSTRTVLRSTLLAVQNSYSYHGRITDCDFDALGA